MSPHRNLLAVIAAIAAIAASPTMAADSGWKFEIDSRDQPGLTYSENGKAVFFIGCGRAFGLHARYPGKAKKDGKATITLANATTRMTFRGEFEEPWEGSVVTFLQWDLGYRRQDPELYGTAWKKKKAQLLDLLAAGPLTLSAQGRSYQMPGANIPDWHPAFDKCG
jgi:hypothetical protein